MHYMVGRFLINILVNFSFCISSKDKAQPVVFCFTAHVVTLFSMFIIPYRYDLIYSPMIVKYCFPFKMYITVRYY